MLEFILTALAALTAVPSSALLPSPSVRREISVGTATRSYIVHVPQSIESNAPVIVSFHGKGMDAADQERLSGFDALGERYGFIAVYPSGIAKRWNDGRAVNAGVDDVGFLKALISDLSFHYAVDLKRIYLAGFSNGGTFAQYFACANARAVAAVAVVSAALPTDNLAACFPERAMSFLEVAGTQDPIMPFHGGRVNFFGKDGGPEVGAKATADFWAHVGACGAYAESPMRPIVPDDATSIALGTYASCKSGVAVELFTVVGGGHAWPGGGQFAPVKYIGVASRQLDASETIVRFLLSQRSSESFAVPDASAPTDHTSNR